MPKNEVSVATTGIFGDRVNAGAGVGGRFTRNLNGNLAIEGEATFFPHSGSRVSISVNEWDERAAVFFGAKGGVRKSRIGMFVKARPGFITVRKLNYVDTNPGYRLDKLLGMHFASDLGGGVEIFPTRNSLIRVDAGTVLTRIVRFQAVGDFKQTTWTGYPTVSIAFGFRF